MVINVKEIRKKRSNRFMKDEEVKLLWQYSKKWSSKWQIIIAFALFRGLRIGEVLSINILDFQDNFTKLRVILEKSHCEEILPLIEPLAELVRDYILKNKCMFKDGFLFPYYTSKQKAGHMTVPVAEALISKLRKEIGKEHINFLDKDSPNSKFYRIGFHSCRRWFETRIYEKTKDRIMLKDIMRYIDGRTVDTYIDPYETWKKEEIILRDTFTDHILTMARIEKGQCRLIDYF